MIHTAHDQHRYSDDHDPLPWLEALHLQFFFREYNRHWNPLVLTERQIQLLYHKLYVKTLNTVPLHKKQSSRTQFHDIINTSSVPACQTLHSLMFVSLVESNWLFSL